MTRIFASTSARGGDLFDLLIDEDEGGREARFYALRRRSGYVLLLLTVGSLLVRPADLIPALERAPIYEFLVLASLAASLPRLARLLGSPLLSRHAPVCLGLLLIPTALLSNLMNGDTYDARVAALEVGKACILLLLVVVQVDTLQRLQVMLFAVAGFVFLVALLALIQYCGLINLPALAGVQQRTIDAFGDQTMLYRLCGIGVFNDPNDFSLVLVLAMIICCYGLGKRRERRAWLLLVVPLAVCSIALILTHSRGGLVAAAGALAAYLSLRIGTRNMMMLAILLVPVAAFMILGRQDSAEGPDPNDTFTTRIELWSSSFDVFRAFPVFGLGYGKLAEEIGQVAHNSFIHAYAEMGMLGGTVFFGAFYLLLRGLWAATPADAEAGRLRPYMLAVVVAYTVGLLSLSRCYTVPTQLVLGLGAAAVTILSRSSQAVLPTMGFRTLLRVTGAGMLFLAATYLFLRVMLQRGSV